MKPVLSRGMGVGSTAAAPRIQGSPAGPARKAFAAQEEALARASIRDQIAYEHPEIARLLPASVEDEEAQTLFERT